MSERIDGIHHVTAISGDPQSTVDFYTDVLGLRLVKQTVNFDDPTTYHLYFGDETGTPGTILTFFPFGSAGPGRVGTGQACATAFAVPPGSVSYWADRLRDADVAVDGRFDRLDEPGVRLRDGDGHPLELIETDSPVEPWADGPVPAEYAIRGFHGVTLQSRAPGRTQSVLETLGFERRGSEDGRVRYAGAGDRAHVLDVLTSGDAPPGVQGPGTVHHVAFRTPDDDRQRDWRERLLETGISVTPQRDRQYFRSIYFREPGGILFEIATDGPGFTRDEATAALGSALKLPPWLEDDRDRLEAQLPPIRVPPVPGAD